MGWGSNYDGWSGLWTFDGYFDKPYGFYKATLPENLSAGTYTITCTDFNGNIMTATKDYTGKMNLPIVPGSSIKTRYDKNGNLSIQWKGIYSGFPYIVDQTMNTSIRVCVWSDQSFWQLTVPAHMNTAFIPVILSMNSSLWGMVILYTSSLGSLPTATGAIPTQLRCLKNLHEHLCTCGYPVFG